jgi:hypothetical protein
MTGGGLQKHQDWKKRQNKRQRVSESALNVKGYLHKLNNVIIRYSLTQLFIKCFMNL